MRKLQSSIAVGLSLLLTACAQNTLPCNIFYPEPECINPARTPEQIKIVNAICNYLNVVDTDRCVLQTGWNYRAIRLCRPEESRTPITPQMTDELWQQVEKRLRDCGHSPLADSIRNGLNLLVGLPTTPFPNEGESVYSIHDIIDQNSGEGRPDTDEDK